MIAVMIFFVMLFALSFGSYFYYCRKKEKPFRLSVPFIPIPMLSAIMGMILLADEIRHYMNRPYIMLLSQFIRREEYVFYIQFFLYLALISTLILAILFFIENFVIGIKAQKHKGE